MADMNQDFLKTLLSGKPSSIINVEVDEGDNTLPAVPEQPETSQAEQVQQLTTPPPPPLLNHEEGLAQLPITLLTDYPDQPIPPYSETSEEFTELLESIRINGIIEPLIVRPYGEGYQIISGRNRRNTATKLAYSSVPCVIRNLSDDEAAICLVETIFRQRDMSKVSLMQKAHTYRLWMDAMNRQGRQNTSCHNGAKRSDEQIAENVPESARTIQRLIRLTYLIDELQELQDLMEGGSKSFPLLAGVEISYLSTENQVAVHEFFFSQHSFNLSVEMSKLLRQQDLDGACLNDELLKNLWGQSGEKNAATKPLRKVSVPMKKIKRFFPSDATETDIENHIVEALEFYEEHKEKKA
jgi:ParB family chromosome partitioning protein